MKKRFFLKLCVYILPILLLVMPLCGCAGSSDPSDESDSETETVDWMYPDYTVVISDGNWYIVPEDKTIGVDSHIASVRFDSVNAFLDALINGTLSRSELNIICASVPEDDIGFRICDIYNLYAPILPENLAISHFSVEGNYYSWCFLLAEGEGRGRWIHLSKEEYKSHCEYFDEGNCMAEKYTLRKGSKVFTVYDIGSTIEVLCQDGDLYYALYFTKLTEKPADDWLLSFGITQYVREHVE